MKLVLLSILGIIGATLAYPSDSIEVEAKAGACTAANCKIENDCRCSTMNNPYDGQDDLAPQLLAITVSESIVTNLYDDTLEPLFFGRKNPDGGDIGLTFYVNHEYTDYSLVNQLYNLGYEIGVHSITKEPSENYWRTATKKVLVEEFKGQREIIAHFANIPIEDITTARIPQLQLEGDRSIEAFVESGLTSDNSWVTRSTLPIFPYTLDYATTQQCDGRIECPTDSHEHFWIVPITSIRGNNSVECNSLATCLVNGTVSEISTWLLGEINRVRAGNRAPITLRLDSYWFEFIPNSRQAFINVLDELQNIPDVFLVSTGQIIEWLKNPVSAKEYKSTTEEKDAECDDKSTCELKNEEGNTRYMKTCVECPEMYPWKGNPYGVAPEEKSTVA